jgi:hypothetical protein
MNLTLQIDHADARNISRAEFRKSYLLAARPLILHNFASLFPAGKLWTFDYLNQKIGDFEIGVFDNSVKATTAYVQPHFKMPFSQFSEIIQRDEETPYRIFLFNLFKEFPEFRKEFPTPEIVRGPLGNIGFAFFGGKNTKVRFHYDIDCSNVLMTQIIGRKRVILIPPLYDSLIYKVPFSSFSLIDPDVPDYVKFPALRFVQGYDFILHPGDALFMPSCYWHFNTYLEGGMAVSYRALACRPMDIYNGIMNTTVRLLIDKILNRILGRRWTERKRNIAIANANEMMNQVNKEQKDSMLLNY